MASGGPRSLMDFIDTPVLVGDPEGRAVYVNPAFERFFDTSRDSVTGVPLAGLFEGGARESVLDAVARVCNGEPRLQFRLRESGRGWVALTSPVEAEEGRVGVVILLTEESRVGDDRLLSLGREIQEPLEELSTMLSEFSSRVAGRPADEQALMLVADGVRTVERIRKWVADLESELLRGRPGESK